ncbi:TRAP transporter substrate-binding protein [Phreatobacter aquaticus]|uniref:TRAP transporter substrate-binding protein n=1 Tax=Phreatobacter aquaticus TaxID=2570229 RepID=A0A4D7QSI0_9HYPH|nr:TRAP transporter substrate-binding protein [Phreatobacter aquaticus]QCK88486.1 TRAP transporter substrate-binding protein [Phreatobacter aquaticus]
MIDRRQILLAGAATLAAPSLARAQAVSWDLSTVWPDANFHTVNANRFAAEVKAATNGAVNITVKGGGQLGFKGPEHLRAVRDGLVPIADVLNIQQIGDEPVLGAEGVPFLVGSIDELRIYHKYIRPVFEATVMRNNQKNLYMVPWPTQYLHLNKKADTLAGLAGVKVRCPDRGAQDMVNALGLTGVVIPWGETIPALASGAVQGVSTSAVSGVDGKFWEFLKFIYPTNHVWSCQMVNVNLDTWNKLTPAQRTAIEGVAKKLEPEFWASSIKADADSLARLKQGGMEVVDIPAPMMADMRQKTASAVQDFVKRVPAAKPAIDAYLAEVKRA